MSGDYADTLRDMLVRVTFRTRVHCRRCGSIYDEVHRHCPWCRRMYSYDGSDPEPSAFPRCGVPFAAE